MKTNVYLPDNVFEDAKARGVNLSRTLRDALSGPQPPPKTPERLILQARHVVKEATLCGARGPIHALLEDLADALEKERRDV